MKKNYVVPTAELYTVESADVLTASGDSVTILDNGDLGVRGSDLFGN